MKPFGKLSLILAAVLGFNATTDGANGDKRRSAPVAPVAAAPGAGVAPASSFEAFRLIVDRNIFNPNRAPRTRAAPEEKPPRVEEIALVGTMNYEKGLVAFFESADASFRKSVRPGESIAEFRVERITNDGVELARDGTTMTLKVAQHLRRVEGGDWAMHVPPELVRDGKSPGLRSPESAAPVEVPADASDVLKRLLKKREKQLN